MNTSAKPTRVVTIGGGTGQFTLLSGLKKYPLKLKAVVSMADDGGSTGVLRDELGVLPPGDIRQCLVALSEADQIMRELWNFRFDQGGLAGHSFGNIFLSTLEKITGSFEEAVRVSSLTLKISGEVIPVTTQSVTLVCGYAERTTGENAINLGVIKDRESIRLEPEVQGNPRAIEALEQADCIVIGPGNLYCSIIPNFLVQGVAEAVKNSRARVIYNCNLMTKAGHTDNFTVSDFVREIERFVGVGRVNFVTCNDYQKLEEDLLKKYAFEGEYPVRVDNNGLTGTSYKMLMSDLVSRDVPTQKKGDPLKRTLIRHNPNALAELIIKNCLG